MNSFRSPHRLFSTRLRDVHAALIVFCCGLALTALTAYKLADIEHERDRLDFEKRAATTREAVLDRVQTCVSLLRGAAGLIAAQGDRIDVAAFRRYLAQLSLREFYPGVLGIGWSRRMNAAELEATVAAMQRQGVEDFHVSPADPRQEYHVILYLEPLDARNRAALGFDMSTEPTRAAAMRRARDSGVPAATQEVTLVQEIGNDKQPGFLIYLPVYRDGVVPATVQERRERLLGYVYAPLRAGDFLSQAFVHDASPAVMTALYDGVQPVPQTLLFRHEAATAASAPPEFALHDRLDVAGTPWTVVFESVRPAGRVRPAVVATLITGILLSVLLALIIWREAQAKALAARWLARERAARNDAEHASLVKDQFLATLSHELRTPLTAILGWAHVVQSGKVNAEQQRAGLDAIERNAKAQVRLIDELLDMSRIMSGKLQLELQAVDLRQTVDACVQSALPSAQQKRLRLEQQLEPVDPLQADPSRLQQVVANLLANAVKFTPEGGCITVRLEQAGTAAKLTISDTGIGIDRAFLPHIFERFRQADASRTRRHGGLGLGLSIVRHLVELHGGTVSAHSAGADTGATFVVVLPCARPEAREADLAWQAAAQPHAPVPTLHRFAGTRMMVVDDEEDTRELVCHVLQEHGAQVHAAASAQDALDAWEAFQPALLLSDIGMPGMDGYALIRRVRGMKDTSVHAIAISAYARSEDRIRALEAGYDAYLVKPLHPTSLLRAVSYFVARARRDTIAPAAESVQRG